jgi:LysR family glycine cleavage system transcriptional activator
MEEEVFPVCGPRTAAALGRLEDLADVTLLHDASSGARASYNWPAWLRAHDLTAVDGTRGPGFTNSTFLVQAAIAERGVMLGRSVLVADALAAGTLVKPFDLALPAGATYWFIALSDTLAQRKISLFRDWLFDAAEKAPLA